MMEKDKDHIELKGISQEGFQSMLEYFYHGHITLVNENVQPCLEAGSFFQVSCISDYSNISIHIVQLFMIIEELSYLSYKRSVMMFYRWNG